MNEDHRLPRRLSNDVRHRFFARFNVWRMLELPNCVRDLRRSYNNNFARPYTNRPIQTRSTPTAIVTAASGQARCHNANGAFGE